jgi:hypothetical protein
MRRFRTFVLATLCLCGPVAPWAAAQPPATDKSEKPDDPLVAAVKDMASSVKHQAQRDPLVRSGLTLPEPQVTLETTRGKGRATGTVGLVKQTVSGEMTFGLAVSSPIGEGDDAEARPVDLRGLADGATLALSVSGSRLFKSFRVRDISDVCKKANVAKEDCTAGKLEDVNPQASQALLDLAFQSVPILYAGSFTYGRNKFSFYDAAGTRQEPVRHSDVAAEGSFGMLVNRRRDLLAFHAGYSRTFTASSNKTQLCRPLAAGATIERCDAATIGEPVEQEQMIGTIEYKWQKRGDTRFPLAFAPKFQFAVGIDESDDVTSFEVPFYIFQEKPKAELAPPKLNGGISAGWRSDNGFQVAVFIGTTFSLFKM